MLPPGGSLNTKQRNPITFPRVNDARNMLFFELLQIAIGNSERLSHAPTTEEWRELYTLAQKQALVGIAFRGVEQLPMEQRPPRALLMQWYMATERIKALNEEMNQKALAVANKFLEEGFPGVVLKGQGIAKLYQLCNYENDDENKPHPNPLQGERGLGLPDEDTQGAELNVEQTEYHPAGNCPPNLGVTSEAEGVYSQHSTLNSTQENLTQNSQNSQNIISSQDKQCDLDLNSQKTHCCARVGHPDEDSQRLYEDENEYSQHSTLNTQQNYLTQNSQKSQNNISSHDNQQNIDLNSQKTASSDSQLAALPNAYVTDGKFSIFNFQFSISNYRTPGDIDIWLHGERSAILEYVRQHVPDCKPVYHHVDFPVVSGVSIEVHFTPTWMNSPLKNHRLQRFFKSMVNSQQSTDGPHPNPLQGERGLGLPDEGFDLTQKSQNNCQGQGQQTTVNGQRTDHPDGIIQHSTFNGNNLTQTSQNTQNLHDASPVRLPDGSTVDCRPSTVDTCLDSKQATLPTPNNAFNRIYILVHIYRHLFAEGIGLKQLLDYYFVLQQGFTEVEREETLHTLRSLGMIRFTRAVMWVLQEVYGLPDRYLLTSPDEEEGRFLLSEIMLAGNFGQHDERLQRAEGEGTFRWGLRKVMRNFRFVRSYPSEVLWSPLFKVWHLFWRMGHA